MRLEGHAVRRLATRTRRHKDKRRKRKPLRRCELTCEPLACKLKSFFKSTTYRSLWRSGRDVHSTRKKPMKSRHFRSPHSKSLIVSGPPTWLSEWTTSLAKIAWARRQFFALHVRTALLAITPSPAVIPHFPLCLSARFAGFALLWLADVLPPWYFSRPLRGRVPLLYRSGQG